MDNGNKKDIAVVKLVDAIGEHEVKLLLEYIQDSIKKGIEKNKTEANFKKI